MNVPESLGIIAGNGVYPRLLADSARKVGVKKIVAAAIADELAKIDVDLLPATTFLENFLAPAGLIAGLKLTHREEEDVDLGWKIAKEIARLDIGQTVIVKNGTVVAVEALE